MLLQELIALLPEDAPPHAVAYGISAAAVGAILWLMAGRFSRYIVPLFAVAIGGAIGLQLPHWFGWSISGAGTAVGAAVVLGITGFVLHAMWTGLGLGIVAALWFTIGSWICTRDGHAWTWPTINDSTTIMAYGRELWGVLPDTMKHILPFGAAASLITGLAMAILWPRLTTAIMWSLTGLTLAILGGLVAANYGRPDLLSNVPTSPSVQTAILAGLLGIGTAIQWKLAPAARKRNAKSKTPSPPAEPSAAA